MLKSFASDNNAGVHPQILDAIARANSGSAQAYGQDVWTTEAENALRQHFGDDCAVFFVLLGTAANVLSMRALTKPWEAVICTDIAHMQCDECGAPEALAGCKLYLAPSTNGLLDVNGIAPFLELRGNPHHNQPKVLSISQSTEVGTLYSPAQIRTLADFAHNNGLYLHMDGTRLCNAAAALGTSLASLTRDAGVDVLSFGGTKNGLLMGEAVIFFNPELAQDFPYIRKQSMQLSSKMRFIAAQFTEYMHDELWLHNARHANAMATLLYEKIQKLAHIHVLHPVQTNFLFLQFEAAHIARLLEKYYFYEVDTQKHHARIVTSFATTADEIEEFAADMRALV